ncbi:MAG: phosphoglucosamine mutase [Oscillospiraceae bacterium]|jgi:phosphoglucosamine mutase|nr:phosphoglucosamine mutase [Oscillospiraceae bacterium]
MGKYFGTDGIRGVANVGLDPRLAYLAGLAAASELAASSGGKKTRVVIGKDTRVSSDMLEAALTAGLCAGGADAVPLGVLPTPAVAYLTIETGAALGAVISASHNPYEHNGIKLFGARGFKIPDELEARIEYLIDRPEALALKTHGGIGAVRRDGGRGAELYIEHVASRARGIKRKKVLLDCANGAASHTARRLFSRLDLELAVINDAPDGVNINVDCGSTHMERLRDAVVSGGFDVGFAFDGDADRCLAADERGEVIDGDLILAVCARAMKREGTLKNNAVVGTIASNAGLDEFCAGEGLRLLRADVGDRHVLDVMRENGCNLGGEPSGHTVFLDDSTTGDGQLAAIKLLGILSESGKTASALAGGIPNYPQIILNVPVAGGEAAKNAAATHPRVLTAVAEEERALAGEGRIFVRASGTEAFVRVTAEAKDGEIALNCARRLEILIKTL